MGAKITRACEYRTVQYKIGDIVTDHEAADKLTRLGFAEPVSEKVTEAAVAKAQKES